MEKQKFKTKREFIDELGISKSTFYRLVKKKNLKITSEMLSPNAENELRIALGFSPLPGFESEAGHIGNDWDNLGRRDE
jgi:hypothetical protein